jgi:hypothetical protein
LKNTTRRKEIRKEEHGFSGAEKPGPKAPPLCRRPEQSPKGEATYLSLLLLLLVFAVF